MSSEIGPKTKIDDLLSKHPFLLEVLVAQSPLFGKLRNPVMRKTMGKVATLETAAGIAGLAVEDLVGVLGAAIADGGREAGERKEALKSIIQELHAGLSVEEAKERFRRVIGSVDATEVAAMEQALIDEGLPAEEIKKLCDVHVEIFKEALEERDPPDTPPGHPIHTYMKENRALESVVSRLSLMLGRVAASWAGPAAAAPDDVGKLSEALATLSAVDIHYTRKENQLFPMLEAHHFTGPSQVMWAIHDDVRGLLKKARMALEERNLEVLQSSLQEATKAVRDMIYKEEHILFPAALDMLTHDEWVRMKEGEAAVGFAWVEPDAGWPEDRSGPGMVSPGATGADPEPVQVDGALALDTGHLTQQQIKLMLTHLPVDVTYVDANDRVAFYSEGPARVFPRSPAIIGREVRNCHPPNSVHVVNMILDGFKSGVQDTAEFWLELGERFIHIRYFAVRDAAGAYQGTIEVSQDVTGIRSLEGERRLLDWQ